jgi:hypothetical protein
VSPSIGNEKQLLDAFIKPGSDDAEATKAASKSTKFLDKNVSKLMLLYDEESLGERKEVIRGVGTVDQLESVYLVSKNLLQIDKKPRLHYKGTTSGNTISPIVVPRHGDMWQETFECKKLIYGSARVAVGGRTEGLWHNNLINSTMVWGGVWVHVEGCSKGLRDVTFEIGGLWFGITRRPHEGLRRPHAPRSRVKHHMCTQPWPSSHEQQLEMPPFGAKPRTLQLT